MLIEVRPGLDHGALMITITPSADVSSGIYSDK